MKTADPELMRAINRFHVMDAIRRLGPISRVEISDFTELSATTVSAITAALLDDILVDDEFGPRIDRKRIGAAGFSLGGYTVIELAGGITSRAQFDRYCQSGSDPTTCTAPPGNCIIDRTSICTPSTSTRLDSATWLVTRDISSAR